MTNLFNSETPNTEQETDSNTSPPNSNSLGGYDTLLSAIKNERGEQKYRTIEDALKALQHSQAYIPEVRQELQQTKAEMEAMREQIKKQAELEKVVQELATRQQQKQATPGEVFDESKIAELVDRRLSESEIQSKVRTNQTVVRDSLVNSFGEKAPEIFNTKAAEYGMSPEEFTALAGRSPKAVLTMLGVSGEVAPKQTTQAPPQGSVRTENFQGKHTNLVGNKEAFTLRPGATNREIEEMATRSGDLLKELQETEGVSVHDLTNPSVYFKYFPN